MAVYAVQGKLGTGKSKFCVWMAQQAILQGRRVAGNLDINQHLLTPSKPAGYIRIPDKPTAFDLDSVGHGNPGSYDETMNGVLILDELGTWLNSRSFQDKERAHLLDWLIHARKKGWDVYLIVQDVMMIDKQVREALVEYSCNCIRMDKVKIPFVGWIGSIAMDVAQAITGNPRTGIKWGYLPFFHLVTARVGSGTAAVVADRWTYIGKDLHACYDTRQIFRTDYEHGAYSYLPPWDLDRKTSMLLRLLATMFRPTPKPLAKPKPRALELIQKLPNPDERMILTRRWLEAASRRAQ